MKTITVLLDGAGDRSYSELNHQTPLQYAKTPILDKLALKSQCGLMTPYQLGCSLGTDLAHFLLFGYDMSEYPGRAVIDAIGEGHEFDEATLILRASFADVDERDGYYLNSRFTKDLSHDEVKTLCDILSIEMDGYKFSVHHSYDSHALIFVKGPKLSCQISDSDPFYNNQYVMCVEPFETEAEEAMTTAELMNKYLKNAHALLGQHPINIKRQASGLEQGNMLLSKWAGMSKSIEPFAVRSGMTGLLLGQSTLLEGLTKTIGLGYEAYDNFEEGIQQALTADAEYIHLHTKAPDSASHKKDPFKKVAALESIDAQLAPLLNFDGLLIVTADHATPCAGKMIHSGETVPFMASGTYIRRDDVTAFDEVSCSKGSVTLKGLDFMHYIQNATDRGTLYHLRAGGKWRNYRVRTVNKL